MKGSAVRQPRPKPDQRAPAVPEPKRNELVEWVKSLAIAVALFLVIRTFLVQAYTIPSGSMEDTLLIGDYLMANNAIFGAQTGTRFRPGYYPFTEPSVAFDISCTICGGVGCPTCVRNHSATYGWKCARGSVAEGFARLSGMGDDVSR